MGSEMCIRDRWIAHWISDPMDASSSPTAAEFFFGRGGGKGGLISLNALKIFVHLFNWFTFDVYALKLFVHLFVVFFLNMTYIFFNFEGKQIIMRKKCLRRIA